MRKQFLRLYAFIIVSVITVLIAFGQIYQNYLYQQSPSITLPITQWTELIDHKQQTMVSMQLSELSLTEPLKQQLHQDKSLAVRQAQGNYLYLLGAQGEKVHRIGPITASPPSTDHSFYFLLAYSVIALVVMSFIWPVFRDLARLKKAAWRFSEEKKAFKTKVNPSSTVYPLAQSLSEMSTRISKFIRLHEDLSRIISHEIRTPLSRMRFMLSLHKELDQELHQTMHRNIDEIENRLGQYLDFARVEHLGKPLVQQSIDAESFITQEAHKNQVFTEVQIVIDVQADQLNCDPTSFSLLLQNLLFNGVKYADKQVVVELTQAGEEQVLEVYDDGPGLPNDADALLQPFSSTKASAVASGYGLGLYIVERICSWHGGRLILANHSETGGASIKVIWPLHGTAAR